MDEAQNGSWGMFRKVLKDSLENFPKENQKALRRKIRKFTAQSSEIFPDVAQKHREGKAKSFLRPHGTSL